MQKLVDMIEDKRIYEELQKLNVATSSKNLICSFLSSQVLLLPLLAFLLADRYPHHNQAL